ncbi:hypothetical protein E1B28_009628 [Marasmius oreades]|uniref:DUF1793-domain-containing protein n=1 Tax=Marasmius oreades TaxID=181124 RepID=A0A9P7RW55_9AGAR|nr:uncharacterized protein E1B28_009628 [Marasmius oreades]KAG7090517.1 hypothetical protein E1B28_009628 [Marasmius oreades]
MHLPYAYAYILLFALSSLVNGQFLPSAAPIVTRSPYLNAWVDLTGSKPNSWPKFWSTNRTLGWGGFIRVNGNDTYEWTGAAMEDPALKFTARSRQAAVLNNLIVTPTRTIFILRAGPIQFNVTYLSPIEPDDIVLQSFPFSYVFLDAVSADNQAHSVQVYSDLSGEWLSFADAVKIQWDTTLGPIIAHSAQLSTPKSLQEVTNMASDGTLYHATNAGNGVTWETGGHYAIRGWFLSQGSVNNTKNPDFRNINDNYPIFGYAHDLGSVTSTPVSVVWAVGLARNPVIRQTSGSDTLDLLPYWTTKYSSPLDGIQAFLADAPKAKERASALDAKIQKDAMKISSNYNDLVSLAARQTFASVETAVGPSDSIYMFMKDIGTSQRVNPVETLYAAFPAFLYINSTWGRYLLEPLLQYETSTQYTASYASPDIGSFFPIAAGQPNPSSLRSIDDSSAMLIMAWAQARFSGDQTLLNRYYSTFQKWADSIISSNPLNTAGAQTADGLDGQNDMSNLAIKGIIGIRAMAEISHTVGKGDDASKYQNQASSWVSSWLASASSGDHLLSTNSTSSSWSLMYNLYPDKLLGMKLVSQEIYDKQDRFYTTRTLSGDKYGLAYDSNAINVVKSHWTMLTAATTTDIGARDYFVKMVHDKATDSNNFATFPSTYSSVDGKLITGLASPAQGAAFGLLTLNLESKLAGLSGNTGGSPDTGSKSNVGAIAGGIVGGLAGLVLIVLGFFFFLRKRKARDYHEGESKPATFFARFGRDQPHPDDPLVDYHVEPMPLPSGYQSQQGRVSYSNSNSSSGQLLQLAPLRLHNADQSAAFQAPPLPRKTDRIATSSLEDVARYNSNRDVLPLPTSPSVGGTSSDASQLRHEVESLRREMEEMRSRTMYEPPPEYT